MIFPIQFDLEKAVNDAGQQWDKKYAKKLEDYINKRPIKVKLDFESLTDVKTRLAQLKIEPITPETKSAIKELASELRTLAKALEQVQKYAKNPTKGAIDASKVQLNEQRAKAQAALAAQRAAKAEDNLAAARLKAARAANVGTSATRNANKAFAEQSSYLSRLTQRIVAYWSIRQVGNFLAKIREVTAEFELQRVSLGAIIQDQAKANMLFSEIKAFALKSPVSILDLTKYTKQLAAYKVGWNGVTTDVKELFDWTKRLTDVSVGLGVSMDRVVLAFGQVRATGYLRASEVRQFTEMGVPIVEELAAKLSKLNGEAVTAADVMDMISKRGISFEMVKDVFDDMTSAGGMFYNMQEKQGNTLYGLWAKLGDAASVMYDEIGNTGWVNQAMKGLIQGVTDVMKHWGSWAKLIGIVGAAYLANAGALKLLSLVTLRYTADGAKLVGISRAKALAAVAEAKATRNAGFMAQWGARRDLALALAKYKAATATNVLSASLHRLWAAFLANPLGWIIAIVGAAIAIFGDFDNTLDNLQGKLSEINEKYTLKNMRDGDNFRRLADGAVKAANGSKEQRDKLEELDRTYGKIVGSENLQIDRLRAMTDGYASLIQQIKEYNLQMEHQEREGEIKSFYGEKKKSTYGDFVEELATLGLGDDEVGHEAGAAIAVNVQNALLEEIEKNGYATVETARALLKRQIAQVFVSRGWDADKANKWAITLVGRLKSETNDYVEALNAEQAALDAENERYDKAGGKLAAMRKEIEAINEAVANSVYLNADRKTAADPDSFLYQQMVANQTMKKAADFIRNSQEMKDALGDKAKELEPEWLHLVDAVDPNNLSDITTINFDAILNAIGNKYPQLRQRIKAAQAEWGNIAPTDATVLQIRQKLVQLSASFDPTLEKMHRFLWDGSGTVDEYLKRLKEQQADLEAQLKKWQTAILNWSFVSALRNGMSKEQLQQKIDDAKKELEALNTLVPFVTTYTNEKDKNKGRGSRQDPRLQNLKEEISLYEKLYQEYQQYEKAVGSSKAVEYMNREAKETIDALAGKYGIGLPKSAKDLTSALEILYKKMEALPPKVFKNLDKELKEFKWKIEKVDIDASQKSIEAELKRLSDRISRTKTAKEFYEKILSTTGNVDMAINLTTSIFGENGQDLNKQIALQINELMQSGEGGIEIGLDVVGDGFSVNYKNLRKLTEEAYKAKKIGDQAYKDLIAIADNGEKDVSKMVEGWLKATEKAQTYGDKLTEVYRKTAAEIARIDNQMAVGNIGREDGEKLKENFRLKEAEEVAKLQYEAFKDSPMYVQMFDDLDHASTRMLKNMKARLMDMQAQWKNLDPTQLKEMQSRLKEIDQQLTQRNPFKVLAESIREYHKLRTKGDSRGNKSRAAADADVTRTTEQYLKAEEELANLRKNPKATQAQLAGAARMVTYTKAQKEEAEKAAANWHKVEEAIGMSVNSLFQMLGWAGDLAKGIAEISEVLGADEEDVQYWNDMADALGQVAGGIQDIVSAAMSGNVIGIVTSSLTAIPKMFTGFFNIFSAGKVRRANKEIKRQQKLLEELEYTYSRLEAAANKFFGKDYLNNYNSQLKNLQAQQRAYEKQAQAERSKGKKEDKEKTKEYLNNARDVADQIKDLQADLAAHFAGSSRTDVAKQMAQSWIEARSSMSDTFAAIRGDYQDMIKNMIVEGAAARVIENALTPMWDSMEKMLADNDVDGAIDAMINGMDSALNAANNGMEVLWKALEARGYDMKQLIGDTDSEYTGIAKNVAGASSEEILQLSGFVNTALYYVSPIPRIDENLARVVALMEGGGAVTTTSNATGWTDWQQQAMDNYMAIARNTAETVVRCERAAVACEKMAGAITAKGSIKGLNVFMH